MAKHRNPLPDDLKELISLCRAGKLFAVQEWIAGGKRYTLPSGNFTTSPFLAALDTGFHSLVEVFLKAGIDQDDKDTALCRAVSNRRLDLVELVVTYGADPRVIGFEDVIWSRHPAIIRWFCDKGLDMEEGYPIAYAFKNRHREFLGIYMGLRDRVPSARKQAAMALRVHCRKANMKWVSLLLWAGADPREEVPDIDWEPPEDHMGSALADAVTYSKIEVVRKIRIDPKKDDVTALLGKCWMCSDPELVQLLLQAGANPNGGGDEEYSPMQELIRNYEHTLDTTFWNRNPEPAIQCLELAASFGGRWRPKNTYQFSTLRRAISRTQSYSVASHLKRIVKSGAIDQDVFQELMKTARMKDVLNSGAPDTVFLREFVGHVKTPKANRKRKNKAW